MFPGNRITHTAILVIAVLSGGRLLVAQKAVGSGEVPALAQGWGALAQGDVARAVRLAADLVKRYPRSAAVLTFGVDASIAGGGATAGLDTYERWLGGRTLEDGYVLRRIARALLREAAGVQDDRAVRLQALDALVTDGETDPPIAPDPSSAALPEAALLAAAGDARGIESLLLALQNPAANKSAAIAGLAKSRSPRAIDPLIALLAEPDPILRAAAAEALGTLGATQAILQLKALLADPVFTVHLAAAGALLALKDTSGLDWLGQLQASEHPGIRLAAARAARGRPDSAWLDLVRSLTRDAEPDIRRQAAELIAPHDPEAARATLEPLLKDSNPAQREAAQIAYLQSAVSDLAELRKFMRNPDALARVHAAGRILQLTR